MKLALYLLAYLGAPGVLCLLPPDHPAATVLAIAYVFLAIPFAIVRVIDFYRSNDSTTFSSRVFNIVFRAPLALSGLVSVVVGAGIMAWVLCNVLLERQQGYTGPSWVLGFGSFGIGVPLVAFGGSMLRSAWRRKETITATPEEQDEER